MTYAQTDRGLIPELATGTVDPTTVRYTPDDQATWRTLRHRLAAVRSHRACDAYLVGLAALEAATARPETAATRAFDASQNLPPVLADDVVPHLDRLSASLQPATGWSLAVVEGLLSDLEFFGHLARKSFPVTWWIRPPSSLDYITEPDLFHDLMGHVPMLMDPAYAATKQAFGRKALAFADTDERLLRPLATLYWFTIEFGLVAASAADPSPRAYGAGILSSPAELVHAVDAPTVQRRPFNPHAMMVQPYRIDRMQDTYFQATTLGQVQDALDRLSLADVQRALEQRQALGL